MRTKVFSEIGLGWYAKLVKYSVTLRHRVSFDECKAAGPEYQLPPPNNFSHYWNNYDRAADEAWEDAVKIIAENERKAAEAGINGENNVDSVETEEGVTEMGKKPKLFISDDVKRTILSEMTEIYFNNGFKMPTSRQIKKNRYIKEEEVDQMKADGEITEKILRERAKALLQAKEEKKPESVVAPVVQEAKPEASEVEETVVAEETPVVEEAPVVEETPVAEETEVTTEETTVVETEEVEKAVETETEALEAEVEADADVDADAEADADVDVDVDADAGEYYYDDENLEASIEESVVDNEEVSEENIEDIAQDDAREDVVDNVEEDIENNIEDSEDVEGDTEEDVEDGAEGHRYTGVRYSAKECIEMLQETSSKLGYIPTMKQIKDLSKKGFLPTWATLARKLGPWFVWVDYLEGVDYPSADKCELAKRLRDEYYSKKEDGESQPEAEANVSIVNLDDSEAEVNSIEPETGLEPSETDLETSETDLETSETDLGEVESETEEQETVNEVDNSEGVPEPDKEVASEEEFEPDKTLAPEEESVTETTLAPEGVVDINETVEVPISVVVKVPKGIEWTATFTFKGKS